jgi:urease accessory protein
MTEPGTAGPWDVWQIVDSAFPTGSFAHSYGLEAAWQQGEVPDAMGLARFVRATVRQTGHGVLPLVAAAHRDPGRLAELDDLADAFLVNAVANRGSRVQGRAWLATCARVWPDLPVAELDVRARELRVHAAPAMGAACRALGVPVRTAQAMVLFAAARGVASAAVRLGIVGSYEAQRVQHGVMDELDAVLGQCADLDVDDLAHTAPVLDILHAGHDRLYTRLFQT